MQNANRYRTGSSATRKFSRDDIVNVGDVEPLEIQNFAFISGVTTVDRPLSHRLVFLERYSDALVKQLISIQCESMLFVVSPEYRAAFGRPRLVTDSPRAVYSRIVIELFEYTYEYWAQDTYIHPTAQIDKSTKLSIGVSVGKNSMIGARCFIHPNVVIGPNCSIGDHCTIKSGSVIGQPGFGISRGANGLPYHFPHVGGVIIEDDVEIGALNTVSAGSIHPTVVGASVKTDDHVHIAHNCVIGERSLIAACSELSGSVIVGENCWIGPNSSIRDGLTIGRDVFVGIGSNVTRSVPDSMAVAGNPARQLRREASIRTDR